MCIRDRLTRLHEKKDDGENDPDGGSPGKRPGPRQTKQALQTPDKSGKSDLASSGKDGIEQMDSMAQSPEVPESATKDTQDLLEEETQKEAERQSKLEAHTSEEQEAMDRSTRGRSRSPRNSEGMSLEDRMGLQQKQKDRERAKERYRASRPSQDSQSADVGATGPDVTKKSSECERSREEEDVPATQPFVASTATVPEASGASSSAIDGEGHDATVLQAFKNLEEVMIDGSSGRHKQFEELTTKEKDLITETVGRRVVDHFAGWQLDSQADESSRCRVREAQILLGRGDPMMEMMRYGFHEWVQHIKPELGEKPTPLGWSADDCRRRPVMKYTPSDILRFRSSDVARTYWKMSVESRGTLSVYLGARSQDLSLIHI